MPAIRLLVGTRKGAFFYRSDAARASWQVDGPHFLGSIINHIVEDPRDPKTLLMAAKTGHLGPTVFLSTDGGAKWTEATRPPAFPKAGDTPATPPGAPEADPSQPGAHPEGAGDAKPKAVNHTFWLTPGHPSEPGVWWAGTSPQALFRSQDGGATWDVVRSFSDYISRIKGEQFDGTPDGPTTHSILIDPRDARHMYVGLSSGGLFETTDQGATWTPLNKGVEATFLPDPDAEVGHDPHCAAIHPLKPDRLYHQNHCGIYRLDRPAREWTRIGKNMPKEVGDVGFGVVLHPRDPDTAWVLPMDGTDVWPRTSPGGRPAVYRTRDAGASWERQDAGMPREQAWFTVFRQALASDAGDPVGVYFGTTSGEIWASADEGGSWKQIAAHLPRIVSVTVGHA